MKQFLKSKFGKAYSLGLALLVSFIATGTAVGAEELDTTQVTESITTQFSSLGSMALIALASIAGIAIGLFAGVYVWRYAKQVFKTIAR